MKICFLILKRKGRRGDLRGLYLLPPNSLDKKLFFNFFSIIHIGLSLGLIIFVADPNFPHAKPVLMGLLLRSAYSRHSRVYVLSNHVCCITEK